VERGDSPRAGAPNLGAAWSARIARIGTAGHADGVQAPAGHSPGQARANAQKTTGVSERGLVG
jgi:hypothetical protein